MQSPVVVASIASITQADLLAGHLRHQGIDAIVRTNLDRTTYAGLGGASLLVPPEQRLEAELELVLLDSASVDGDPSPQDEAGSRHPQWIRTCGIVLLGAMVAGTALPSLAIIWQRLTG